MSQLRLDYAAVSDVGRVRKDNQDSGYAGPWLLSVCDGVGGAARGDIASSTAIGQIRRIDERPAAASDDDLLGLVAGAIQRAHDRIGDLVEQDPSLNGTSTTAVVALFDGQRLAMGHVGDSRAYLLHDGELRQITKDHTFVQTLIDEGRITEEESRVHPHRNLILKAIDGMRDAEPDLFFVPLAAGDRVMLCSDGITASLTDDDVARLLARGTVAAAAAELTRASLDAGSTDNVTCIVADALEATADASAPTPVIVGAAATPLRRGHRPMLAGALRHPRHGESAETPADDAMPLPEIPEGAISDDPDDAEAARYALRPPRRGTGARVLCYLLILLGVLWVAVAAGWSWTQSQWYVGDQDGDVTIFRGVHTTVLGFDLSSAYQTTDLKLSKLPDTYAQQVREGIHRSSLTTAQAKVHELLCDSVPAAGQSGTATTGGDC